LKQAIADRYMAAGGQRFMLLTSDRHRDTRRHAERVGVIEETELWRPTLPVRASEHLWTAAS
ncbi:MAG: hypothetical protein AAF747_12155, partial [Planctomycetota bacterium]